MSAANIPSLLPPISAAPVSTDTRLAYVLRHFGLAFSGAPMGLIGYPRSGYPIEVAELAGCFFEQQQPYPAAPNYRTWAGQQVPFFFDPSPAAPLLELAAGMVCINADIISAAFYLLSGWQEYFSETRDQYGRFPYAASVQQRYGFVALPVVNYYFDVLRTAVEHVTGQPLRPRSWNGAPFSAFISHDIDNLRSAWKAPAKASLKQGQLLRFGQRLWQRLTRPDAWDNLEAVAATVAKYGARSTFFILPEHRPGADGTPNADYRIDSHVLRRFVHLGSLGSEMALHGSIGTATDFARLLAEQEEALGLKTCGNRFHYLRWEPRQTPIHLEALVMAGLRYDSTLGFAEHFGFRHSYCHPFHPFDFARGQAHSFLEIPLQVMDATLHHPNYLQLRADEILPALQPMLAEVEKFGGVASILWHNDHFDPSNTVTGPQQFAEIMGYLQQRGAAFLTGSQIVAEL
jgi:peptidoglycan/xylan/chitin deacetylase (PgdA/CDA1 family)